MVAAVKAFWILRAAKEESLGAKHNQAGRNRAALNVITANLTPRKCLGFKTPFQAILKELGKDAQIRFS